MIYVTYGSQSGNSEAIATRIYNDLKARGKTSSKLMVLNNFLTEIQKFPENKGQLYNVIIVCSTTGNGDAPNNAEKFVRWIKRKTHSEDILSNVKYAVLGLGDSNYSKYQYIPRQLDEYFSKLGAQRFYKKGEADDAYGLEMVVEPWIEGLYKEIEKLNISTLDNLKEDKLTEKTVDVSVDVSNIESYNNAKVIAKKRLSGLKAQREIFSLKFECLNRQFETYSSGASISIIPPNDEQVVNKVLGIVNITEKFLVINKSHHFSIYSEFFEKYPHFQKFLEKGFLTYLEIFKYIIDFNSTLRKLQMENIRNLFKSKLQNIELLQTFENMFSKYTDIIVKNKISLYDILLNVPIGQLSLSLSEIIEFFPIKQPRSYSLVSNTTDGYMEIAFSVLKEKITLTKDVVAKFKKDSIYYGQCTNYLKQLNNNDELFISGISNYFKFPTTDYLNQKPIIYICNGTGITPCVSFLTSLTRTENKQMGQLVIFTGFRNASSDKNETIYEDVITAAVEQINHKAERDIIKYFRCLSVSSDNEEEEIGIWRNCRINTNYVQDLIIDNEDLVYELLFQKEGYLMICGDVAKLYDECINNIIYILSKKNGYPREHALKILEGMKFNNKIIIEKWI
jgi:sulfite reductase alpha subunit-like flavoprotein